MLRSLMFVPAATERFVLKASESGADAVILDLEDSIADADKDHARSALAAAVPLAAKSGGSVFVRINSGPRMMADIHAAIAAGAEGLVVPKVSDAQTIERISTFLDSAGGRQHVSLIPVLEHPEAILCCRAISQASRRILGLIAGGEDLGLAMNADPNSEAVRTSKILVHLAAKAAGVMSFGLLTSIADFRNVESIRASVEEARKSGFDGATCIHPSAISILNHGFAPSAADVDYARRLLSAHACSKAQGAFEFEGRMIDAPHLLRARRIVTSASQ